MQLKHLINLFIQQFTTRGKIRALLQKNFLRMWRNVGVMLFIFALPVMQVILFCLAIGRDPTGLRLAIVNNEMNSTTGECFFEKGCAFSSLSCRYLSHLNDSIIQEYYPNHDQAQCMGSTLFYGVLHRCFSCTYCAWS